MEQVALQVMAKVLLSALQLYGVELSKGAEQLEEWVVIHGQFLIPKYLELSITRPPIRFGNSATNVPRDVIPP